MSNEIKRFYPNTQFTTTVNGQTYELFVLCEQCNLRIMGNGDGDNQFLFCPRCGGELPHDN